MSDEPEAPACPVCTFPMAGEADYCPHCQAPLSRSSTFDPLKVIRTEGELFRRGASRPSGIAALGIWLIFGPPLLVFAVIAVSGGPFGVLIFAPLLLLLGAILLRVTAGYSLAGHDTPKNGTADK